MGMPHPSASAASSMEKEAMQPSTEPALTAPSMVVKSPSGRKSTLPFSPAASVMATPSSQVSDWGWGDADLPVGEILHAAHAGVVGGLADEDVGKRRPPLEGADQGRRAFQPW